MFFNELKKDVEMNLTELKEKFNALSKPKKVILIFTAVVCLLGMICQPKIETGYTRIYDRVCISENKCVSYKLFDKILVSEYSDTEFKVWNDKKEYIGKISKKNVVFEGTPEYEQTKKERADIDKREAELKKVLEEKLKKERAAELARLEPIVKKAFYKVDIRKFSDDGNGIYDFYINPIIWARTPFDQKQNIFKNCVTYVQLKLDIKNDYAKIGTKIKSSSNAAVLAEYSIVSGIKIK